MVLAELPKHKQSAHHKKRIGQHHKPSKHYAKTYWPYLPMLMVVVAGLILNATWNVGKGVLGYATNMSPSVLLSETNIQRSNNGESALAMNSLLSQAAQAKANDMVARNYWSHVTPDGIQPWQFIANTGYSYSAAGENLAYGFDTSSSAVSGWMNSPSHRANILNDTYQEVGFGIANSPDFNGDGEETVVVAMYGKPAKSYAPSTVQNGRAASPAPTTKKVTETPVAAEPTPTPAAEPTPAEPTPTPAPIASDKKAPETTTTQAKASEDTPTVLPTKPVSRIDVLTDGNAQWAALALSVIATVCAITFLLRHARLWKRYLLKGEEFVVKHPLLDTVFVAVGVIGYLLTQTSGFIR
jgi:cell division septation protein DedD